MRVLAFTLSLIFMMNVAWADEKMGWVDQLKEKARPLVVKVFGKEKADAWLGEVQQTVALPKIPEVKKSSTSTDNYDWKDSVRAKFYSLPQQDQEKYNYAFIDELFKLTRRSKAEDSDFRRWLNTLNQGATREGIYRALMVDDVYAALLNYDEDCSQRLVQFVDEFLEKYLNQGVRPEVLKDMRFFALKRLVVDKTLDLLEVLKLNREDLENWYAVFSADIAKRYPQFWKNALRKNDNALYHQAWARTNSVDHIKVEIALKLHKVLNHLM